MSRFVSNEQMESRIRIEKLKSCLTTSLAAESDKDPAITYAEVILALTAYLERMAGHLWRDDFPHDKGA